MNAEGEVVMSVTQLVSRQADIDKINGRAGIVHNW